MTVCAYRGMRFVFCFLSPVFWLLLLVLCSVLGVSRLSTTTLVHLLPAQDA